MLFWHDNNTGATFTVLSVVLQLPTKACNTDLLSPSSSCCSSKLQPAVSISSRVGSSAAALLLLQDGKSASVCPATDS